MSKPDTFIPHLDNLNTLDQQLADANDTDDALRQSLDFAIGILAKIVQARQRMQTQKRPKATVEMSAIKFPYLICPVTIPDEFSDHEGMYRKILLQDGEYSAPIHINDPVWLTIADGIEFDGVKMYDEAVALIMDERKGL